MTSNMLEEVSSDTFIMCQKYNTVWVSKYAHNLALLPAPYCKIYGIHIGEIANFPQKVYCGKNCDNLLWGYVLVALHSYYFYIFVIVFIIFLDVLTLSRKKEKINVGSYVEFCFY